MMREGGHLAAGLLLIAAVTALYAGSTLNRFLTAVPDAAVQVVNDAEARRA